MRLNFNLFAVLMKIEQEIYSRIQNILTELPEEREA